MSVRTMRWMMVAVVLLQIGVILSLPVMGDEPYFIAWGHQFQWGIYDHPPLPGWIAYLLGFVLSEEYQYRFFSLGCGLVLAWFMYRLLREHHDQSSARWLTIAWYVLPANLLVFSMYLNDTVAYVCVGLFSLAAYYASCASNGWRQSGWAALAGLFLGLAMLTKYLSGAYALAYVVFVLLNVRRMPRLWAQLLMVVCVSTLLFWINLRWNYEHCQINFTFSFFHRKDGDWLFGLGQYVGSLMVLLGPALIWLVVRHRKTTAIQQEPRFFSVMLWVVAAIFLLSSLSSGDFGAHWGAPLMWLAYLAFGESRWSEPVQKRLLIANVGFGGLVFGTLLIVSAGIAWFDAERWLGDNPRVSDLQFLKDLRNGSIEQQLMPYREITLSSELYATTSAYTNRGFKAALLFNTSQFGRNDDIVVDYREMDGTDVLYLEPLQDDNADEMRRVFESVTPVTITGLHRQYTAYLGRGFRFDAYKRLYIDPVIRRYYSFSVPAKSCHMDRYVAQTQEAKP